MKRIAIFATGGGSNAEQVIKYFQKNKDVEVSLIISNKQDAYVLTRAANHNIPTHVTDRNALYESEETLSELKKYGVDFIVLAGFLWLIPEYLIDLFHNRIINIHPALLPDYGGRGMYGIHVHRAVKENNEKMSGMTIHYVNKKYDDGAIIFQASCLLDEADSPYQVAEKVLALEHKYYAKIIDSIIKETK